VDICSKNIIMYQSIKQESRDRNARRIFSRNCRHLMPLFKVKERWNKGEQDTKGERVQETKKRRRRRILDAPTCPRGIESRGLRRAENDERSTIREKERRKRKKKKTFYGHGGSCCCLFAVGQRRRGDRRKSPVRRSQLNPSARGDPRQCAPRFR